MIKYNLKCSNGHEFESWFKSSADYDRLSARALVECAICGSASVKKQLMAPQLANVGKAKSAPKLAAQEREAYQQMIKTMKAELKSAKNVGWQFATEARAMHYGEKETKPIYGRAEPDEAIELLKEGVGLAPLPFDPDAKEN